MRDARLTLIHWLVLVPSRTLGAWAPALLNHAIHHLFRLIGALERLRYVTFGGLAARPAAGCPLPAEWLTLPAARQDSDTVLVFLPGGAFTAREPTGLSFAGQILPRLAKLLPPHRGVPPLLVVAYTLPSCSTRVHGEVEAMLEWLAASGRRVLLCGDSAGGHLAFCAALRCGSDGRRPPLIGTVLICPWVDLALTSDAMTRNARSCLLAVAHLRRGAASFVNDARKQPRDDQRDDGPGVLTVSGEEAHETAAALRAASPAFTDFSSLGESAVFVAYGAQDLLADDARCVGRNIYHSESVSTSERQDMELMPRETGTRQGRAPPTGDSHRGKDPATGDPHRREDPAEDPSPEGRASQGTHTEHIQTLSIFIYLSIHPSILPSIYLPTYLS